MKQPYNTKIYNTALYMRLSKDDELQGESGSIQTQRMMLRQYASEHGMCVVDEYIDDGWSGTNFDRPSFQRMIDDIEDGKINCVVTKDLSRLGRNYILTGQYTEIYFPSKGVRYVAINDNVDTENGESELAPFLNILNEMHARQTSKKVKAAMHTLFTNGAHYGAYAPLGYKKDPNQVGHLIVDEDTKWIVEKMFDLAAGGAGMSKITKILTAEKIPTPGYWSFQRYGYFAHVYTDAPEERKYAWSITQVHWILRDETYLGHSVHYRQRAISYKNKKRVPKPKEEWFYVENTHEAIISADLFAQVQAQIASRRRERKTGEKQIFSGLLKCADCGYSLSLGTNRQREVHYKYYHCSKNSHYPEQCTMHYIRYEVLYDYVLHTLQYWAERAHNDEDALLKELLKSNERHRDSTSKQRSTELRKAQRRKLEIDNLFSKMYEDWSSGRITEYNFNMLSKKYQDEQIELDAKIEQLQATIESTKNVGADTKKWIATIKQWFGIEELTADLLNATIEKIVVHEADGNRQRKNRVQEVEIFYRFIGKIDP